MQEVIRCLFGSRFCRRLYLLFALLVLTIAGANLLVVGLTHSRCYDDLAAIPARRVGLVLGAGPGTYYYWNRMRAAADLHRAGKVDHLLVSGDNGHVTYDESTNMKETLMKMGVPEEDITCDFAGFRTLDSLVRAKKVFCVNRLTVITQRFHNYRALYIARHFGVDAIAYDAAPVPVGFRSRTLIRECVARVVAVVDLHVTGRSPRFLGPKEPIVAQAE